MNQQSSKGKNFKGIGVNVLLLGIVSFLNDLSSEMIMPTLPMFISSLGGGSLAIGLLGGIRDSMSSILNVFAGYWSDKTGKRQDICFQGLFNFFGFQIFPGVIENLAAGGCACFGGADRQRPAKCGKGRDYRRVDGQEPGAKGSGFTGRLIL